MTRAVRLGAPSAALLVLAWVGARSADTPVSAVAPRANQEAVAEERAALAEPASRPRSRATGACARVRVVETRTGEPLEAVSVDAWTEAGHARAVSDGRGALSLPLPGAENARVRIDVPLGWESPDALRHLTEEEWNGIRHVVLRMHRLPRAAVRARAVDALTGEPIPGLPLGVRHARYSGHRGRYTRCDEPWEPVTTGPDGVFQTGRTYHRGTVEVRLGGPDVRRPRVAALEHLDPGRPGPDLVVPIGPTYELETRGPVRVDQDWSLDLITGAGERRRLLGSTALRTEGARTWVRFPALPLASRERPPFWLVASDAGGRVWGIGGVRSVVGAQRAPVVLDLEERGALSVRVVDAAGAPLPSASLRLGGAGTDQPWSVARTDARGSATLAGVPPGRYELVVAATDHVAQSRVVEVDPGPPVDVEVELVPPTAGRVGIHGRVESVGGTFRAPTTVTVHDAGGALRRRVSLAWRRQGARWTADFDAWDLEPGEYTVRPHTRASDGIRPVWEPAQIATAAPARGLRFLVRDDERPAPDLYVEVFDDRGRRLDRWALWSEDARTGEVESQSSSSPRAELVNVRGRLPLDRYPDWLVGAPGHRPRWLTVDEFVEARVRGETALLARVELRPGWGTLAIVRDDEDRPVVGAAIEVDGVEVGRTDDRGRFLLEADARPRDLRAVHLGLSGSGGGPRRSGAPAKDEPMTIRMLAGDLADGDRWGAPRSPIPQKP